jgi:hypothetical protein
MNDLLPAHYLDVPPKSTASGLRVNVSNVLEVSVRPKPRRPLGVRMGL